MSAATLNFLVDGMDIRQEYACLLELKAWHPSLKANPPRLDVTVFQKRTKRLGSAWFHKHRVKLNFHSSMSKYDVQEILIHELAHFDTMLRYPGKDIGHGDQFWATLDIAFAEAYPGAEQFLMPRLNRFHGRYARALKFFDGTDEAVRTIAWEIGTKVEVIGFDKELVAATLDPEPKTKLTTAELDERVLTLISSMAGSTRAYVEEQYPVVYGEPYPGKTPYNSMWRLAKAGLIERHGRVWLRMKGD